jgi:hypothetical protein
MTYLARDNLELFYFNVKSKSSFGFTFIALANANIVLTEGLIRAVSILAIVERVIPDLAERDSCVSFFSTRTSLNLSANACNPCSSKILTLFTA